MPRSSSNQKTSSVPMIRPAHSNVVNVTPSLPTFGQTLKEGFAFGTGSAIAHRLFNPITIQSPSDKKIESPCEKERLAFESCMKTKSMEDFCGGEQSNYSRCLQFKQ